MANRTPPIPTCAVIYLRVSTSQQAESGLGIEAQRAKCLEHAARLGLPVVGEFIDNGISGRDGVAGRPGLRDAIAASQARAAVVIFYSLSRLGRSQRLIWELLDERGSYRLPVSSATESFDTTTATGRAMLGMLGIWAQLESDLCSERTTAALGAAKARGTKLGAPSMVESLTEDGRVADPYKVALVAKVQAFYREHGLSVRATARALNEAGVPSVLGGRWHPKTLATALATNVEAPHA